MHDESHWTYDGPLSTYREWDSLLYGIAIGALLSLRRVRRDIAREPSKCIAGVVLTIALAYWRGEGCASD